MDVRKELREARNAAGLSQQKMSDALGKCRCRVLNRTAGWNYTVNGRSDSSCKIFHELKERKNRSFLL